MGVNTVIQRRGARIALFTTAGFTDMLDLARLRMPNRYSLFCERLPPLVPHECVFPIAERMAADGATLVAPQEDDVAMAVAAARRAGCDGVGILLSGTASGVVGARVVARAAGTRAAAGLCLSAPAPLRLG